MTPSPFPPELRTASIINRWSVVWTLNRDSVANHSYFVALYSYQIAELIGWRGDKDKLVFLALTHDLDETCTGDLVSPVKKEILDRPRADAFIRRKMRERMLGIVNVIDRLIESSYADEMTAIVKAADRLDAVLFLTVELRMGNRHVFSRCQDAKSQLEEAWSRLPWQGHGMTLATLSHPAGYKLLPAGIRCRAEEGLSKLWREVVLPAVKEHEEIGGAGV